jgi:hypothetical protein
MAPAREWHIQIMELAVIDVINHLSCKVILDFYREQIF